MFMCNPYDVCVINKTEDGVQTTVLFHADVDVPVMMVNLETHTKVRMIESTSDCDFSVFRYQYIVEFCQALIFDR